MKETKLVQLLKKLPAETVNELIPAFQSPLFSMSATGLCLMEWLLGHYPDFEGPKVNREAACEWIWPQQKVDDVALRRLFSHCLIQVENYLILIESKTKLFENQIELARYYRNKDLTKHRNGVLRKAQTGLVEEKTLSTEKLYREFTFSLELQTPEAQRKGKDLALGAVSDQLDLFYLVSKMKYACILLNQQNVYQQEIQLNMVEEVLTHLEKKTYEHPLLNAYHHALRTLLEPEAEANFWNLKSLLAQLAGSLAKEEGEQLHALARNYCIKKVNQGHPDYIRNLFELYQLALKSELLINDQGEISAHVFKNIVLAALRLREFEWAEEFIRSYAPRLSETDAEDFLHYNLARLEFEKANFEAVMPLLRKVSPRDLFLSLDVRVLRLKTLFERDQVDLVESGIEGLKLTIRRNKMLAYHQRNYLNFLRYFKALVRVNPYDQAAVGHLLEKIKTASPLTEKEWLVKKLQGL